jgi:hypothetical protein
LPILLSGAGRAHPNQLCIAGFDAAQEKAQHQDVALYRPHWQAKLQMYVALAEQTNKLISFAIAGAFSNLTEMVHWRYTNCGRCWPQ